MSGKSISGDARFPHLPPIKDVVLKHWTLVSDDLITTDRNSGQYKATFKCNIVDGDGKVCGADRNILHYRGKCECLSPKCLSLLRLIQSVMRFGGGLIFQKANVSVLSVPFDA
jgi:hypothetical protein